MLHNLERGHWHNPPELFSATADDLTVRTDNATDFWRETYYGFTRDRGHFYAFNAEDGFTAQVRVQAQFEHLYDQAGLMVRIDERRWARAGIEFSVGHCLLSSVLTNETSDWATGRYTGDASDFRLRMTVQNGVMRIQASDDGHIWRLLRLCPFPKAGQYLVGPMCCTPERGGLDVRFLEWQLGRSLDKDLHDMS